MLQTTVIPFFFSIDTCYDVLIPYILYVGIFRTLREGIAVALLLGFFMDNLSGAIFGLYMTTYFWLLLCTRWMNTFLRFENQILIILIVVIGVLIENILFVGVIVIQSGRFPITVLKTIWNQLVWAAFTGIFIFLFIGSIHWKWNNWIEKSFILEKKG